MTQLYYSVAQYVSDGGTGLVYTIPFPYIQKVDIYLYVGSTQYNSSTWEFLTPTQVKINRQLSPGDKVTIRRITRSDQRLAEYWNGAVLTENDLNIVTTQLLYLIQELLDWQTAGSGGATFPGGPPTGGGGGGGGTGPDDIQAIIDELLNSQLFKDLTELIPLVDINAETIISNALKNHEDWSKAIEFKDLIDKNNVGLQNIDAKYTEKVEKIITDGSATVTALQALQARYDGTAADYISFKTAQATTNSATASSMTVLSSRMTTGESRIGTLEQTKIDSNGAMALIQQQIDAKFTQGNIDGSINASSYIQAIRADVSKNISTIAGITSYVAGSGVVIDANGNIQWPANPTGGLARSISVVQSTVNVQASQLSTEALMRQTLASKFAPGVADNPIALVAGMESAWRTYADNSSAVVSRVSTLEVNRQPIFFRSAAPNPYAAEFGTMYYGTNGFPRGSVWYMMVGTKLYPYYWEPSYTSWNTTFYGPFTKPGVGAVPGIWISYRDDSIGDVLGARIDQVASTQITANSVKAQIQDTLTTVFNAKDWSGVNTIASRLTSLIDPTRGLMYSSWNVRINQYLGSNTPVVAGVGLGMQSDPNNPQKGARSQFIVMADQFGVIKPPSYDPLGGPLDLNSVIVPFVIDASTQTIGINGRLLVKGSLGAYDGAMGRLLITDLNNDATVKDFYGSRLVLPSGFNNYNASNSASPWSNANPQRFLMWAGSGVMNHNNATFYIDVEGNGYFAGRVQAKNVIGQFNDAVSVQANFASTGGIQSSNNNGVSMVGSEWAVMPAGDIILDNGSGYERQPFAMLTILVDSGGVNNGYSVMGFARFDIDYESNPGVWANDWKMIQYAPLYFDSQSTITLAGGLGRRIGGRARLRVLLQYRKYNSDPWRRPYSSSFSGIFMGVR